MTSHSAARSSRSSSKPSLSLGSELRTKRSKRASADLVSRCGVWIPSLFSGASQPWLITIAGGLLSFAKGWRRHSRLQGLLKAALRFSFGVALARLILRHVHPRPHAYVPVPPVGRCIYCGCADKPLTDEHPIPLSLGGHLVLPKASCTACASKTHYYEDVTARTTFGNFRMRHGFPTRRKKERPTHIEFGTVGPDGVAGFAKVPVTEFPAGVFLPHVGRAGVFIGSPPHLDTFQWLPHYYGTNDMNEFAERHRWDKKMLVKFMPIEFGQTLIKTCYAYAVAEFGANAFTPICIPQILSQDKNISFIFGQDGKNENKPGESVVWDIKLSYFLSFLPTPLVMAHCSFLPGMGTPIYEVVLGIVQSQEHIALMNEYARNHGRVEQV